MHIKHNHHIINLDFLSTLTRGPEHQKHYLVSVTSPCGETLTLYHDEDVAIVKRPVDGIASAIRRGDALFDADAMTM